MVNKNIPVVLASASPRRAQLLTQLGLEFKVMPVDINESAGKNEPIIDYVRRMAKTKALVARRQLGADALVIAADTIVSIDNKILGKPEDRAQGLAMLSTLSACTHRVYTAVVVSHPGHQAQAVSASEVSFRRIDRREAVQYWLTGEPQGKAGGYAIQGRGALFVNKLSGSYRGVVGLPLFELGQLLTASHMELL